MTKLPVNVKATFKSVTEPSNQIPTAIKGLLFALGSTVIGSALILGTLSALEIAGR